MIKKVLVVLAVLFTLVGCSKKSNIHDTYPDVPEDNVFTEVSAEKALELLTTGDNIIFFGFPECPWCQAYAPFIDQAAKATDRKVYYCNILEDRTNNTKTYQKIVEKLDGYLDYDEEGKPRIYVPNLTVVSDGLIIGNDFETANDTKGFEKPEEYWNVFGKDDLIAKMENWFSQLKCAKCN